MDMNLLCAEALKPDNGVPALKDILLEDDRVLHQLLYSEHVYVPKTRYFEKPNFDSSVRRTVTKWMQEVCEEEDCLGSVYPLAVNFFDRFLCKCEVPKKFLQLLASGCMLISSKIRQNSPITVNTLCYYTNHSITPCQLRNFELLITSKLEWDLSAVTGYDFVDQLLQRIHWHNKKREDTIINHAVTLVHLCYSEMEFYGLKPSLIAASAMVSALRSLNIKTDPDRLTYLCSLLKVDVDEVEETVAEMERIVMDEMVRMRKIRLETKNFPTTKGNCKEKSIASIDVGRRDV